jgi:espin
VFCRYYCSKPCQVSDWPRHKAYHKSLESNRVELGGQHLQHAFGSLALREDKVAAEAASCSDEAKDDNGMTALLRAASANNWKEARKLVLSGADPSVADDQGLTALHYAAFYGSSALAQTLIDHGPAGIVFCEAPRGGTSLHLACQQAHLDIAKALIDAGGEALLLKTLEGGGSCLYIACQNGHVEIAMLLIKAGGEALLLKTLEEGVSCLHVACQNGHVEIATLLI